MTETPKYADFTWPARWNKGEVVATLSQSGPDVMAVNFMGVLRFRLDDDESVAAIVNAARRFADAVEASKRRFDGAMSGTEVGGDPFSPPRTAYATATLHGLVTARDDLDRRIALAQAEKPGLST
jgi:hypothetical protein